MSRSEINSLLKELTEQKAPSAQINLWPAIQSRIQVSQTTLKPGNTIESLISHKKSLFKPAALILAVILISGLFLLLPQGQALAQNIWHFFYSGDNDLMPGTEATPIKWIEQTPGVSAATATQQETRTMPVPLVFEEKCGANIEAHCSVEKIRSMVTFPVYALEEIPFGMYFSGATGNRELVSLYYMTHDQAGFLLISERPFSDTGSHLAGEVGVSAQIQIVQVGSVSAEYVKGSYDGSSNPPQWNNNIDMQMLRWVNDGVVFDLYLSGMEERINRDELVFLASSLSAGPLSGSGQPMIVTETPLAAEPTLETEDYYPLTLAEAEALAGFKLLLPVQLPENFTFDGARYDEEYQLISIVYIYHNPDYPEAQGGLVIKEQASAEENECGLCGFTQGDGKQAFEFFDPFYKMVSNEAVIEPVRIGDTGGQYVEGIGWSSATEVGGWQWDPTPFRKRLRFQIGDVAIELWMDEGRFTKEDMITIAEGMR